MKNTRELTAAVYVRQKFGIPSIKLISDMTGVSPGTLDVWYKTRTKMFDLLLKGCAVKIKKG